MKFLYRRHSRDKIPGASEGVIYKPIVPIVAYGPSRSFGFDGLVDTGSDQIILPAHIASYIGVSLHNKNKAHISSFVENRAAIFFVDNIHLALHSGGQVYRWPARVWFSDSNESLALLGHIDFLQFFTSTFDGKNHELILEPNSMFHGKLVDLWK